MITCCEGNQPKFDGISLVLDGERSHNSGPAPQNVENYWARLAFDNKLCIFVLIYISNPHVADQDLMVLGRPSFPRSESLAFVRIWGPGPT